MKNSAFPFSSRTYILMAIPNLLLVSVMVTSLICIPIFLQGKLRLNTILCILMFCILVGTLNVLRLLRIKRNSVIYIAEGVVQYTTATRDGIELFEFVHTEKRYTIQKIKEIRIGFRGVSVQGNIDYTIDTNGKMPQTRQISKVVLPRYYENFGNLILNLKMMLEGMDI